MKHLLKKILYKDIEITEYSSISITGMIQEKVYLKTKKTSIDITTNHWVLSLEPLVFGIWFGKDNTAVFDKNERYAMFFEEICSHEKNKTLAVVTLHFFDQIDTPDGILLLLRFIETKLFHTSALEALFLYKRYYHKPTAPFKKIKSFVSAYSYPRKVRIISFLQGDYYNIFPMDLLGNINGTRRYIFGLRHTNRTLARIIETKKLLVSEVPSIYKEEIYKLGKHHSSAPPPTDMLPFKVSSSRNFGFPVPDWAEKYNEINIVETKNLGSHMLLWGESQYEEILKEPAPGLYHIHFLLYLYQKRHGNAYTLA